jgi:hypothetical protein
MKNVEKKKGKGRSKNKAANLNMAPFSKPGIPHNAVKYIRNVLLSKKLSGDHDFTKKMQCLA